MKKYILLIFIINILFAKLPTCYSVQLLSSFKALNIEIPYDNCKKMKIGSVYTLRCGCYEHYKQAKPFLKNVIKKYPKAAIVTTYKYRFQNTKPVVKKLIKKEKPIKRNPNIHLSKATCYSVQLLSSFKALNIEIPYDNCKKMKIGSVYTLRCGCYEHYKQAKPFLKNVIKKYPKAAIVTTYKYRFQNTKSKVSIVTLNKKENQSAPITLQTVENLSINKIKKNIKVPKFPVITPFVRKETKSVQKNTKETNNTKFCNNSIKRFYIEPGLKYALGQKPFYSPRLHSDSLFLTLGMQYFCNFADNWFFIAEPKLSFKYSNNNSNINTNMNFDFRQLYIKSIGLNENQLNFLIGRKVLKDKRSWYYDSSLDTIGIYNLRDLWLYRIFAGGRLNNSKYFSQEDNSYGLKHTKFIIANLQYEYFIKNYLKGFFVKEITNNTRNLSWVGLRSIGKRVYKNRNINYWLDYSLIKGNYQALNMHSINSNAFDVGFSFNKNNNHSTYGASYARGGKKFFSPYLTNYRSSFLTRNVSFRYYGELLNPDLNNIKILSLYWSYDFFDNHKALIAFHNYKQTKASTNLRMNNQMILNTNGISNNIGNEIDFIYNWSLPNLKHYKFIISYFKGGGAFDGVAKKKEAIYVYFIYRYYF